MGPATQFDRIVAAFAASAPHGQHANLVAVFLAEQCQRTRCDCIIGRHQPRADLFVGADFIIHLGLDRRDIVFAQRLRVRKVEAETVF